MSLQRIYRNRWERLIEAIFGSTSHTATTYRSKLGEQEAQQCRLCGVPADFLHASPSGTGYIHWSGACFAHRTYLLNHTWTMNAGGYVDGGPSQATCTCHGQPYGECAETAPWKNSHLDGTFYAVVDGEHVLVSHTVLNP